MSTSTTLAFNPVKERILQRFYDAQEPLCQNFLYEIDRDIIDGAIVLSTQYEAGGKLMLDYKWIHVDDMDIVFNAPAFHPNGPMMQWARSAHSPVVDPFS